MRKISVLLGPLAVLFLLLVPLARADAHGFSSVVYADVTAPSAGHVRVDLELEYDLMLYSVADAQDDDALVKAGQPAWDAADFDGMAKAVEDHEDSVLAYVDDRFGVAVDGTACRPTPVEDYRVDMRDVPYLHVVLDYACPETARAHEIHSTLFPDDEGYVTGTKTIVTYDLDFVDGSAALDSSQTSFSTDQSTAERFWEFFKLGVEHLLTGIDHLLFLLALIAGSRRLREIVLAATTFTLAHSVTLMLAAFGVVAVSPSVVEPIIALSIAVVAAWHLWRLATQGEHALDLDVSSDSHFALDRAGWIRLAVVFCFGLVHGLGFAGALGIQQAWSWSLLWSLVVFNLGIEAVQLSLIVLLFPMFALLRRKAPTADLVVTGAIAATVTVFGLVWFVQRLAAG
ncbi:aromatic ring-opening dioxygenase LigA [Nocardioides sp. Root1257]|uniref:HupE/UreJ family protein n=1 Tax=unclassified Nocardioides TaxID=2615069 RepID=UPI0006FE0C42|nr:MULTISPECIES: HupE/UreJ family protein [unclassified Nocardioides]KQW48501.1 aromatic ring-opening dioxygenase LigA [Nocardioides sp. Root1257]KRC47677.1 aromatic ring-opening dioxygenase LigA [Nocardioides sp. Root224]